MTTDAPSTAEDLLSAAAFSLRHLLSQGMQPGEAADALWREHERHCLALGMPQQYLMLVRDGIVAGANAPCRELFPDARGGKPFLEYITEDSGEIMARRACAKAEGNSVPRLFCLDFLCRDGSVFAGEVSVSEIACQDCTMALALISPAPKTGRRPGGRK